MAVVLQVVFPGLTPRQYDQLKEEVDWVNSPPKGGISHLVWWEGNDCHGVDVWDQKKHGPRLGKNAWARPRPS
jgi:hypothetical protein